MLTIPFPADGDVDGLVSVLIHLYLDCGGEETQFVQSGGVALLYDLHEYTV